MTNLRNKGSRLGLMLLAVPLSLARLVGASATPATAAASVPAPSTAQQRFEVQFMKRMIDHHFMAVRMGEQCVAKARHERLREQCVAKARHERLREQCAEIAKAQREEIRMMRSWLRRWDHTDHKPHLGMSERAQLRELASAKGAKYEIMIME